MTRRYTIAPSARVDLDEIWFYIARKSSADIAESVVEAITGIFPLLAANPAMGRHRPNLGEAMRSFLLPTTESITGKTGVAVFEFCMSNMPPATRGGFSNKHWMLPLCFSFCFKTEGRWGILSAAPRAAAEVTRPVWRSPPQAHRVALTEARLEAGR
jgi:plasmid stabilization system protein ParE